MKLYYRIKQYSLPINSSSSLVHVCTHATLNIWWSHFTSNRSHFLILFFTSSTAESSANHSNSTGFPVYPHSHSFQRLSTRKQHATQWIADRCVARREDDNDISRRWQMDCKWDDKSGKAIAEHRADETHSSRSWIKIGCMVGDTSINGILKRVLKMERRICFISDDSNWIDWNRTMVDRTAKRYATHNQLEDIDDQLATFELHSAKMSGLISIQFLSFAA